MATQLEPTQEMLQRADRLVALPLDWIEMLFAAHIEKHEPAEESR